MEYERCIFKALPNKFEILIMETSMLVSLYHKLRFTCDYEFEVMQAITKERIRREKNGM